LVESNHAHFLSVGVALNDDVALHELAVDLDGNFASVGLYRFGHFCVGSGADMLAGVGVE